MIGMASFPPQPVHDRGGPDPTVLALVRGAYPDAYALSTEGCSICATCTYPDAPCRFPDQMHPAVESYSISVVELAKISGVRYINGADSITYFSVILF